MASNTKTYKPQKIIKSIRYGGGSSILRGCFAARRTGAIHYINFFCSKLSNTKEVYIFLTYGSKSIKLSLYSDN